MLRLVVLILLFSQILYSKSLKEHWRDLNLKIDLVNDMLSECKDNETNFLGCAFALDSAFKLEKLTLIPKTLFDKRKDFGDKIREFEDILIAENRKFSSRSLGELYNEIKNYKKELKEHWIRIYEKREQIKFEIILDAIKDLNIYKNDESFLTATIMNVYLNVKEDPHTIVIPTKYFVESIFEKESYVGIGAEIRIEKNANVTKYLIESPLEDSPALKAGIRSGDEITEINGKPVLSDKVLDELNGPIGTTVELTIKRKGETLKIKIVREVINSPNVKSKSLEKTGTKLGYIKLSTFMSQKACDDVKKNIEEISKNDIKGLIFDLRNNPGGLFLQASCISGLFLNKNAPIAELKPPSSLASEDSSLAYINTEDAITKLPMVTLINSKSASASELVAAALQDNSRSFLVGTRTFGKGSVQTQEAIANGLLIKFFTIAWFYRPSGFPVQLDGVTPDFTVYSSPKPTDIELFPLREEDEYLLMPPEISNKWKQPRSEVISSLSDCVKVKGLSARRYEEEKNEPMKPDYELMYSEDVLNCAIELKIDSKPNKVLSRGTEIGNGGPRKTSIRFSVNEPLQKYVNK